MQLDTRYVLDMYCRSRSRLFIYTGQERVGKFKFVFIQRLHVAATLFCLEFICRYVSCVKAKSMS